MSISQKLGYISVVEALKNVTKVVPSSASEEKYKVISPETMQETFMSDSEDEGGKLRTIMFIYLYNFKNWNSYNLITNNIISFNNVILRNI